MPFPCHLPSKHCLSYFSTFWMVFHQPKQGNNRNRKEISHAVDSFFPGGRPDEQVAVHRQTRAERQAIQRWHTSIRVAWRCSRCSQLSGTYHDIPPWHERFMRLLVDRYFDYVEFAQACSRPFQASAYRLTITGREIDR